MHLPLGDQLGSAGWGRLMGGNKTCLTIPSTIFIFSRTLGYNCLSLNYLYFNFRDNLMRKERERGAYSTILPHQFFLSLAPIEGQSTTDPRPHQVHALVLWTQGGNRGLGEAGRGHSGRGDSCSQS